MEEAMVIRKDGTGKRFGFLAVLMAAVFLVFMGAHTVYGAGGLDPVSYTHLYRVYGSRPQRQPDVLKSWDS